MTHATTWLFDLDGTLADTAPDLAAALNHVLTRHGRAPIAADIIRPYAGFGSARLIELGFGAHSPDEEELKHQLLDYYVEHIADYTRLFPGMDTVLDTLDHQCIPWGVVTNKPARFTDPLLRALNIYQRAAIIVSGNTTAHSKPHPEPIYYALKQLSCSPSNALYIGDSSFDYQACRTANVTMVCAGYGYLQSDDTPETWGVEIIHSPLELLNFLP
jgi:N-acetyl-D-muramate 6-phosphate phosphatase